MKYNSEESQKKKTADWILSFSGDIKKSLGRTHEAKVKIITQADDLSTEEKLKALDNNDYQLLLKLFMGGTIITGLLFSVYTGKPIDYFKLEKASQKLVA